MRNLENWTFTVKPFNSNFSKTSDEYGIRSAEKSAKFVRTQASKTGSFVVLPPKLLWQQDLNFLQFSLQLVMLKFSGVIGREGRNSRLSHYHGTSGILAQRVKDQ